MKSGASSRIATSSAQKNTQSSVSSRPPNENAKTPKKATVSQKKCSVAWWWGLPSRTAAPISSVRTPMAASTGYIRGLPPGIGRSVSSRNCCASSRSSV